LRWSPGGLSRSEMPQNDYVTRELSCRDIPPVLVDIEQVDEDAVDRDEAGDQFSSARKVPSTTSQVEDWESTGDPHCQRTLIMAFCDVQELSYHSMGNVDLEFLFAGGQKRYDAGGRSSDGGYLQLKAMRFC